jgi:hypothetical protein
VATKTVGTSEQYKAVMSILTKRWEEVDALSFLIVIGSDYPELFLEVFESTKRERKPSVVDDQPWMGEVKSLISAGKFVEAIKLYRNATGLGLKEAKDACDILKAEMGLVVTY